MLACAAVTASALAFALYARVDWPWFLLGWIGLIPWLAVLDRTVSLRGALAAGLLMCEAFVLAVFSWFPSALQNYTGWPWTLALLVTVAVAPLMEPQFLLFALARHVAKRDATRWWYAGLVGACAYVGSESALPKLFGDTLGHGLYASALIRQAADVAGAHGLTFALIVANECGLAALRGATAPPFPVTAVSKAGTGRSSVGTRLRNAVAPAACVAALAVALLGYGALRYRQLDRGDGPGDHLTAGVVQADISQYGRLAAELGTFDATRTILDAHFALSSAALAHADVDVLVWPETVYPTTFGSPKSEDGAAFDREIGAFVTRIGVPLIFGAYDADGEDEYNAAVFLEPATDGRVAFATYRKTEPFPLTERVPALLEGDAVRRWLPWLGTWKAGNGARVVGLALRDGRTLSVAPLICYDALDPALSIAAVRQGAEVIVTLSNDSWFSYDGVPRLILVIAAFRSIETRRPQVRATNTGISAVITPTGEFLVTIPVHERGAVTATVMPERSAMTLMLNWGDWFGQTALVVCAVLLGAACVRRYRILRAAR